MDWCIRWFWHKEECWKRLVESTSVPHLQAYAYQQIDQWKQFADRSKKTFTWVKDNVKENRKRKRV